MELISCRIEAKLTLFKTTNTMDIASLKSALLHKQSEGNSSSAASKSAAKDAHMLNLGLGSLDVHAKQGQLAQQPLQHCPLLYIHAR